MKTRFLLASAAFALAACVAPPPRVDPLAGLGGVGGGSPVALKGLSAALLLKPSGPSIPDDEREMFDRVVDLFSSRFKEARAIESVHEGQDADIVALVDIQSSIPGGAIGTASVHVHISLMSKDQQVIDELQGRGVQGTKFMLVREDLKNRAQNFAAEDLGKALSDSAKLAGFAAARKPSAPALAPRAYAAAPAAAGYPPSDVDAPSYKSKEDPDKFAMVVGIEKYSGIPEAQFAEHDASAVKRHLLALGYPERNIIYLTGQQASRAGLAKNLESWLPRNVGENSTVFFYYSGHGAPDTKSGQAYLLPWDGDAQFLEDTAYPVKRLYEKLNALKAAKVVVALDACFSGGGGRSILARGARPLVTKVDTGSVAAGKLIVLAASGADEITGTDQSQGHGLFTYYLLKGLEGEAADKKGRVTLRGIYDYLLPKVRDAARRQNRDQTPQLLTPAGEDQSSWLLR